MAQQTPGRPAGDRVLEAEDEASGPPDHGAAHLSLAEMRVRAAEFARHLEEVKGRTETPPWGWYPYAMLPGFIETLDALLTGENRRLVEERPTGRVADIGGADGDLSFFLDSLGWKMDLYDGGADRIRELRLLPAHRLNQALGASVELHDIQLDRQFTLPRRYDLVFFLGVLYHLRNPMLALECVARSARYCVISTKVARYLPGRRFGRHRRRDISDIPVAYLFDAYEIHQHVASNYWVFSRAGICRAATRSGWEVLDYLHTGNPDCEPGSAVEGRAWVLLRSRLFDGRVEDPMHLDEERLGRGKEVADWMARVGGLAGERTAKAATAKPVDAPPEEPPRWASTD